MEIKRSGSVPSGKGAADRFSGAVRLDPCLADGQRGGRDCTQGH